MTKYHLLIYTAKPIILAHTTVNATAMLMNGDDSYREFVIKSRIRHCYTLINDHDSYRKFDVKSRIRHCYVNQR